MAILAESGHARLAVAARWRPSRSAFMAKVTEVRGCCIAADGEIVQRVRLGAPEISIDGVRVFGRRYELAVDVRKQSSGRHDTYVASPPLRQTAPLKMHWQPPSCCTCARAMLAKPRF